MPARLRDALAEHSPKGLWITKHPDGCLMVFPDSNWDAFEATIQALPYTATGLKRIFLGSSDLFEVDSAGRISLPAELREHAGLTKELRLYGMGSHFELWDAARYSALKTDDDASAVLQQVLQNLVI